MTKPTRFLATCLLVVSIFGAALADGGQTQGGEAPAPPPPPQFSVESATAVTPAVQEDSLASLTAVALTLLAEVLL